MSGIRADVHRQVLTASFVDRKLVSQPSITPHE